MYFFLKSVTPSNWTLAPTLCPIMESSSPPVVGPLLSNKQKQEGLPSLRCVKHSWISLPAGMMTRRTDELIWLGFLWNRIIKPWHCRENHRHNLFFLEPGEIPPTRPGLWLGRGQKPVYPSKSACPLFSIWKSPFAPSFSIVFGGHPWHSQAE